MGRYNTATSADASFTCYMEVLAWLDECTIQHNCTNVGTATTSIVADRHTGQQQWTFPWCCDEH
jgi:hypothetical protein